METNKWKGHLQIEPQIMTLFIHFLDGGLHK